MKKFLPWLMSAILLFLLTACASAPKQEQITMTELFFDTIIRIDAWGADTSVLDGCRELCTVYEQKFSNKIETSEVSQINAAGGQPVSVSDETLQLIREGIYYSKLSGGAFDITIAPLSDLWNFTDNPDGRLPDSRALDEARSHIGYENILIDSEAGTVSLKDPQAKIDLGGIAKGYIADQLKAYLMEAGVTHALINLGGNVLALSTKPDGTFFRIGLQKPFDEQGETIDIVEIEGRSVVSSGTYERYFEKDGVIYHHILDPKTGYPYDNNLLQVTIISDYSVDGDALSTTCFALGLEKGSALIESLDHVQAIFITDDFELHYVGF